MVFETFSEMVIVYHPLSGTYTYCDSNNVYVNIFYSSNLKCAWLVTSSISGSTILLLVTDMTVNCAGVAINVYDGKTNT